MEGKKIRVLQQVLNPNGIGGVTAEFRALENSALSNKYEFIPMILTDFKPGVNIHDIRYYYRCIKREKPDIVHIRGAAVDGLNAVIAAKIAGQSKILVTVHGMYSDLIYISRLKKWVSKNIVERAMFLLADGISCVCHAASQRSYFDRYIRKMLPVVYNRIPNYNVDMKSEYKAKIRKEFNIPLDGTVGIYVGRITKEKGLSFLVDSLQQMETKWKDNWYLLIVGDGDYYAEMRDRIARMKIFSYIIFCGSQSEVSQFLLASDFFVQPSLHENHSIALLEACAARIPSIATDVGGNSEIVDSSIGIIIKSRDVHELKDALMAMYESNHRQQLLHNIEKYSFDKFSDTNIDTALDSVYQAIMEK